MLLRSKKGYAMRQRCATIALQLNIQFLMLPF